ncbi:MAG: hypothetical protein ACKVTZ_13215 [Bacteroidia bacterium]
MTFGFTYSPYWILPICLLAAFFTWIMYRRTGDELPVLPRILLSLFRFIVLSTLGILLLEPIFSSMSKLKFPPIVVFLQDASESIVLQKDANFMNTTYKDKLKKLLKDFPEEEYIVEGYRFDKDLKPRLSPDSLSYKGNGTNIAEAIKQVQGIYENQNLGAIVVLSDGITTSGMSPLYALEGMKQPVYSVLLGDTTLQKDIKIKDVIFNELAYLSADMPIKVKVQNDGYETADVKVTLSQDGAVIATKPLILSKNQPNGEVEFAVRPKRVGMQQFQVSVTEMPNEITYKNNSKLFSVNVIETRLKIAIFAGAPHPDLAAIEEALKHEEGYQIKEFFLKGKGEYYTNPSSENFKDFNIFILHNYPNSPADAEFVNKIANEVKTRNVPLVTFVGMFTDLQTMQPLFEYMSLSPSAINPKSEEVTLMVSDKYKNHTTFTYGDTWLNWAAGSPPVFRNRSEWTAKTDAEVFITAKVKNIPMNYPVMAIQSHLGRKNMTFIGENIWRMRMHAFTEGQKFDNFDDWIFNTSKWLMVQDDKRKFRAYATKNAYGGNEPVILKGEAYNDSYEPMTGAEIKASVKFPNGKINDYFLTETGNARYALEIYNLQAGEYSFKAEGKKDNKIIGTDAGQFTVGRSEIEHLNLRADKEVMQQMAARTKGEFFFVNQMDSVASRIKKNENLKPIVDYRKNKKSLMDWWQILVALLALLSVEWVMRKWYNLL